MATIGPMARFVDDLTLAYNVVRGAHPTAPYTVPTQPARPEEVDIKRLACAVFTEIKGLVPVSADIRSRVENAGQVLERLGLRVEFSTPPIQRAHEIWWDYALADGGELARQAIGDNASLSRERLQRLFLAKTPHKSAAEFFTVAIERDKFRVELAQFMERYPIIISAPFCCTAFAQGATKVQFDGEEFDLYSANWPALWVNCAGLPAVVVPAGLDGSGLPVGVQIVGRAFEEEQVLAVARALEKELGGYQKPPL
jgi:amidase